MGLTNGCSDRVPSGMAPHTVLDPGEGMAGSYVWQKLKLLKALTSSGTKEWVGGNRLL